jgi:hypothetical protein
MPAISIKMTISCLFCSLILHMALKDDLGNGLQKMKYALNHSSKFQDYKLAFLAGLVQASTVLLVETLTILAILQGGTVFNVVLNFIVIAVLAFFDDLVYRALRNEKFKKLLESDNQAKILEISYTTSSLCNSGETG